MIPLTNKIQRLESEWFEQDLTIVDMTGNITEKLNHPQSFVTLEQIVSSFKDTRLLISNCPISDVSPETYHYITVSQKVVKNREQYHYSTG